jgi:hypothetical protein
MINLISFSVCLYQCKYAMRGHESAIEKNKYVCNFKQVSLLVVHKIKLHQHRLV